MNQHASETLLMSTSEESSFNNDASTPRRQRRLIDYTLTNGRNEASAHRRSPIGPQESQISERKLRLPPIKSLDETIFSSSPQSPDGDMVEFWLRIPPKRKSRTSSLGDIRDALSKTRNRSQKSPLFGSFSGNGEMRRSYADLRDAFRLCSANSTQDSSPRSSAILIPR